MQRRRIVRDPRWSVPSLPLYARVLAGPDCAPLPVRVGPRRSPSPQATLCRAPRFWWKRTPERQPPPLASAPETQKRLLHRDRVRPFFWENLRPRLRPVSITAWHFPPRVRGGQSPAKAECCTTPAERPRT